MVQNRQEHGFVKLIDEYKPEGTLLVLRTVTIFTGLGSGLGSGWGSGWGTGLGSGLGSGFFISSLLKAPPKDLHPIQNFL